MMKPLLMASAIALAAPVMAQNTTVDDMTMPPASGVASPTAPLQTPPMAAPVPAQTPTVSTEMTDDQAPDMPAQTDMDADMSTTDATATANTAVTGTDAMTADTGTAVHSKAQTMGTRPTGVGGPLEPAAEYPVCSRTITDSCLQVRGSPTPN